jgi:hypothetical protein
MMTPEQKLLPSQHVLPMLRRTVLAPRNVVLTHQQNMPTAQRVMPRAQQNLRTIRHVLPTLERRILRPQQSALNLWRIGRKHQSFRQGRDSALFIE